MSTMQGFSTGPIMGARRVTPIPEGNTVHARPKTAKERRADVERLVRVRTWRGEAIESRDEALLTSEFYRDVFRTSRYGR